MLIEHNYLNLSGSMQCNTSQLTDFLKHCTDNVYLLFIGCIVSHVIISQVSDIYYLIDYWCGQDKQYVHTRLGQSADRQTEETFDQQHKAAVKSNAATE